MVVGVDELEGGAAAWFGYCAGELHQHLDAVAAAVITLCSSCLLRPSAGDQSRAALEREPPRGHEANSVNKVTECSRVVGR